MNTRTEQVRSAITGRAPENNPVANFRGFLEKQKSQLAMALPKHITPDRMIRLATTEFAKNPMLQKCTQVSVYGAIIQASQLGLEIGVLGQAYLVPYKNNKSGEYEAQFIPGYKGLISLARRSGEVTSIETHIVYENDHFDLKLGLETQVVHEPFLDGPRGTARLVYGVATFRDGGHHFEWMSIEDVNRIRQRSKARDSGPWVTDYEQMVRKTLIRRMANYLPMSIELAAAIQISEATDEGKRASIDGDFVVVQSEDEDTPAGQVNQTNQTNAEPPKQIPEITFAKVAESINKAKDIEVLEVAADLIGEVSDPQQRAELAALFEQRRAELSK